MPSLNKCAFIGNVGKDPEIRTMGSSGDKVANLSLACSESWRDKNSGEKREKTTWVPVVVFGKLVDTVERYVNKGDKLYIEGAFQVRKWQDRDGNDRYSSEIILQGFGGKLIMLGSPGGRNSDGGNQGGQGGGYGGYGDNQGGHSRSASAQEPRRDFDLDDDIPF